MKFSNLMFRLRKDTLIRLIEQFNSVDDKVAKALASKNIKVIAAKSRHQKLINTQNSIVESITDKRKKQLQCEESSLSELQNNTQHAFKLLHTALIYESQAIKLHGKLEEVRQNVKDIEFDINTMLSEIAELYDAQKYILQHNKYQSPEVISLSGDEYRSNFVSQASREIDAKLYKEERAFDSSHYSISEKLSYDDIEAHLESILVKVTM